MPIRTPRHSTHRWSLHQRSDEFRAPQPSTLEDGSRHARLIFESLGPLYASLAIYLGSRLDLLPPEWCREFSLAANNSPAFDAATIEDLLRAAFTPAQRRSFFAIHPETAISTWLTCALRARLANGAEVRVTLLRPECYAFADTPIVARSIDRALVRNLCGRAFDESDFNDFFLDIGRQCSLRAQLEILESMPLEDPSHDSAGAGSVVIPRIFPELSNDFVLTVEQPACVPLPLALHSAGASPAIIASSLLRAWLYQALRGHGFPAAPHPAEISIRGRAILFSGTCFLALPGAARDNLWRYLQSTLAEDPDQAAGYLLREMISPPPHRINFEGFRCAFRQAAHFGALKPLLGTDTNALSYTLFQHWKTALDFGYRPRPHLLAFYRGLFSTARICHSLHPFGDPIREGLEELHADRLFQQMNELTEWNTWFQNADKFAGLFTQLPTVLDDTLTRAATAPVQEAARGPEPSASGRNRHGGYTLILMCILAALLLCSQALGLSLPVQRAVLLLVLLGGWITLRKSSP